MKIPKNIFEALKIGPLPLNYVRVQYSNVCRKKITVYIFTYV